MKRFHEVYGGPGEDDADIVDWSLEEFLVLSLQEICVFGDRRAVLDRMGIPEGTLTPSAGRKIPGVVSEAGARMRSDIKVILEDGGFDGQEDIVEGLTPVHLLKVVRDTPTLLGAARGEGGVSHDILSAEAGLYGRREAETVFLSLSSLGILSPVEGKSGYFVLSEEFAGEDERQAKMIINSILNAASVPGNEMGPLERTDIPPDEVEAFRSLMASVYDIERARQFITDMIPAEIEEGRIYEIRYDVPRMREYSERSGLAGKGRRTLPEALIFQYVNVLKARTRDPRDIRLIECGGLESLISVRSYTAAGDESDVGEMSVDIQGPVEGRVLRMIGMLNIAVAGSTIPDSVAREEIDDYANVIAFIKRQFRSLGGGELSLENIIGGNRLIELPPAKPIDPSDLEEHYRTVVLRILQAA